MFGKLKEKLKAWTKKVSEEKQEDVVELPKKQKDSSLEVPKPSEVKEISIEQKFDPGKQKFEPDLEKAEEIVKEIKEEEKLEGETPEPSIEESVKPPEDFDITTKDAGKKLDKQEKKESLLTKIRKVKITEKEFEIYEEELEMLLLENNVAVEVAEKIIKSLKEQIVGKELLKKEIESEIFEAIKQIINEILLEPFSVPEKIKNREDKKPFVILFCGINGTGKTTTIAKIAEQLKKENLTCVLAAADTFRAASIEQIKKHAEKLKVPVIAHEYGHDPASVGFDAIKYAEKNKLDAVLIDTAGRMHNDKNLMSEIEKISKVTKPDLKIFVGESITGNDAVEQVKSFNWAIGIDGIILSKADIDEKGGTALSVGFITKKPILYLGTGQEYNAIEPFDKAKFIKRLGLE